ncbi:MAG: glycosyltransferase [Deltaproteobacteria bacterium]|nr:glycosyltransferase [Deltaproteobacteria bacterium]
MRWVLVTVGSRGDVQPFVALGRGLQAAGHTVVVAALEPHRPFVEAHGIEFASLGATPARFTQTPRLKIPFHGVVGRTLFWSLYRHLLGLYLPRFSEVCRGADRLVFSGLAFPVQHIAQQLGVPAIAVTLVPHTPTRAFVDPFFARSPLAGVGWFNAASAVAETQLMLQSSAGPLNEWRTQVLGLPRIGRAQWSRHRRRTVALRLHAYSPHLLPQPDDWPGDIVVTGAWTLAPDPRWSPAAGLVEFLRDGDPPVYVGFGSMTPGTAGRLYRDVFTAVRSQGQRVVVAADGSSLDVRGLAARAGMGRGDVYVAPPTPHEWLLPRVALAIHHGGVGTVTATHRAGIPSVIVPYGFDQFFWAQRVVQLGSGLAPTRWQRPHATWLSNAITCARQDPVMRAMARRIRRALESEDGVSRAVEALGGIRG